MIIAKHSWFIEHFLLYFARRGFRKSFRNIRILGEYVNDTDRAVLLLGNHFSWWDGFIQLYLNQKVIKKQFHVMMLEEQLQKHMILNKSGAFSIKKGSRSVVESLNYASDILENPGNLLVLFPQGEIQSLYTSPIHFEKGLSYLLKKASHRPQIIFNINLVDYFSHIKPELSIYFKTFEPSTSATLSDFEDAFNIFAQQCIKNQKEV